MDKKSLEKEYVYFTEGNTTIPTVTLWTGEVSEVDGADGCNIFAALKKALSREGFPVKDLCFGSVFIQPVKDSEKGDMDITIVFNPPGRPKARFTIKTNTIVGALAEASKVYLSKKN